MRIIAGSLKGRQLVTPRNLQIRPTTDRVKQIIFDSLGIPFRFVKVLDLFAGTGNLGWEAISRGASTVTFVDKSNNAVHLITQNRELLSLQSKTRILRLDVFQALREFERDGEKFDLIFADPPYHEMLFAKLLQSLDSPKIINPDGMVVIEHSSSNSPLINLKTLQHMKTKNMGETSFSIFSNRDDYYEINHLSRNI